MNSINIACFVKFDLLANASNYFAKCVILMAHKPVIYHWKAFNVSVKNIFLKYIVHTILEQTTEMYVSPSTV